MEVQEVVMEVQEESLLKLGISGYAPRRLEAQNRRGDCFYFYTLPLFLIFTLVRAISSQFSLAQL